MDVRVLVVDDSSEVRALYRRIVGDDDEIILVGEAENGQEALDKIGDAAPDVVVMDVQMPVMGGVDATRKIKERWPDVSVLGCTASNDRALAKAMAAAGAAAYIDKAKASKLLIPLVKALGSGPAESGADGETDGRLETFLDGDNPVAEGTSRTLDITSVHQQVPK